GYLREFTMRTITMREAIHQLTANPKTLIFGAMSEAEFAHEHIPGSLWLNPLDPSLDKHIRAQTDDPFHPMIIYGVGPERSEPYQAALQLEALGFQEVTVFANGLTQWRDDGYA